jgi:hypothetical protein
MRWRDRSSWGTDGSEPAERAVWEATDIAARDGAHLVRNGYDILAAVAIVPAVGAFGLGHVDDHGAVDVGATGSRPSARRRRSLTSRARGERSARSSVAVASSGRQIGGHTARQDRRRTRPSEARTRRCTSARRSSPRRTLPSSGNASRSVGPRCPRGSPRRRAPSASIRHRFAAASVQNVLRISRRSRGFASNTPTRTGAPIRFATRQPRARCAPGCSGQEGVHPLALERAIFNRGSATGGAERI